jgi:cyclase
VALQQLAQGVYAWLQLPGGMGRANAGVVVDEDGLTVVDTLMVPSQWHELGDAVTQLGRPVHRIVLTSGQIEFAGGTSQFRFAAVFGSEITSLQLDQPPNVAAYRRFMPEFAAEFDDLETKPVTHVVDAAVMLTPAAEVIPIAGHTPADLMVLAPAAGVLFAGGMCSFGVTPLAFQGDPAGWADALDTVADLAPTIVPGHGPVGSEPQVRELQDYLRACVAADGDPDAIPAGPWDRWPDRHLDAINVERAALLARGEDRVPSSMLRAIGATEATAEE